MSGKVDISWQQYDESTKYLAQGSSTSSKAPALRGVEPALIARGKGCRVWDLDGNEYIDFRNGLGPVTLGYCIDEINDAITEQLNKGIVFGQPHPLAGQVAKALVEVIPCAERVRFLKTGGEAIAACIKIARNATSRNKILHCGYNGWINCLSADGFRPAGIAAAQPSKGVPPQISSLHKSLPWADIEPWKKAFEQDGEDIAAVVIACSYAEMEKGHEFLPAIRELTSQYGTLMIFDEIVTGFRLAIGGAQEYFNVTPDMAVFSKGMANGMPISAYLGKAELIDSAKGIGISSTFADEALSMAAAKAVMRFYREKNVIEHIWTVGKSLWGQVSELFEKYGVAASIQGTPVCPLIVFEDPKFAATFFAACYSNGLSLYNVPYVNYSHKAEDIVETVERMERALKDLANAN